MNGFKRGSFIGGPVFLYPDPKCIILTCVTQYTDQSVGTVSLEFKHFSIKSVEVGASQYPTLGLLRLALDTTSLSILTDFRIIINWKDKGEKPYINSSLGQNTGRQSTLKKLL